MGRQPASGDSIDSIFESIGEHHDHPKHLIMARLGVLSLTVPDAAELVAVDLWDAGEIEADGIERSECDDAVDKGALVAGLQPAIEGLVERFVAAINRGDLAARFVTRNLNDRIDPYLTYLELHPLREWLATRGYGPSPNCSFAAREEEDEIIAQRKRPAKSA